MRRKRNTMAYTIMAWASFLLAMGIFFVSVYNAGWPLMEKGLYSAVGLWLVSAAITLQKVLRDNEEDKELQPPRHNEG